MVRRCLAALALIGCMFVLSAEAEDGEKEKKLAKGLGDPEMLFKKIDTNGDNKVTKEEFKKFFDEVGKGKLEGKGGALGEKIFEQLDADKDGKLTLEEFKKLSELREKLGGKLDPEKLKALKEKLGNLDPEQLKALKEKFGGKIDLEKLKELKEKRADKDKD